MTAIDFGLGRLDGVADAVIEAIVAHWQPIAENRWLSGEGWMEVIHTHWPEDATQGFSPRFKGLEIGERDLPVLVLDSLVAPKGERRRVWSLLRAPNDLAARREMIART